MVRFEGVHGTGGHLDLAVGLEGQTPLDLESLQLKHRLLVNPPCFGPRVGAVAIGGLFLASQQDFQRVDLQPARLREEQPVSLAGIKRLVGDLNQGRPDAGGHQQLAEEEDHKTDADQHEGDNKNRQEPVRLTRQMASHGEHDEDRHQTVPEQTRDQGDKQRPSPGSGHRKPEGERCAGAVGDVGAQGDVRKVGLGAAVAQEGIECGRPLGNRCAALRRLSPGEHRVDQAAPADQNEGQGHQKRQPDPPTVSAHQDRHVRIGRIVPAIVLFSNRKAVENGLFVLLPRGVTAVAVVSPDVVRPGTVAFAVDLILDLDLGPVEGAVFALNLSDASVFHHAAVLDELVFGSPLGHHQRGKQHDQPAAAQHEEDREEQRLAGAAELLGTGRPVTAFFLV